MDCIYIHHYHSPTWWCLPRLSDIGIVTPIGDKKNKKDKKDPRMDAIARTQRAQRSAASITQHIHRTRPSAARYPRSKD